MKNYSLLKMFLEINGQLDRYIDGYEKYFFISNLKLKYYIDVKWNRLIYKTL